MPADTQGVRFQRILVKELHKVSHYYSTRAAALEVGCVLATMARTKGQQHSLSPCSHAAHGFALVCVPVMPDFSYFCVTRLHC